MPTRRKLISTSGSANTALWSTSDIPGLGADPAFTIAFWVQSSTPLSTGQSIFADDNGSTQIWASTSEGPGGLSAKARYGNTGGVGPAGKVDIESAGWTHYCIQFDKDQWDTTGDILMFENGVEVSNSPEDIHSVTPAIESSGTHSILGDDNAGGSNTDGGCVAEIFDFILINNVRSPTEMNFQTGGSWKDVDGAYLSDIHYRIDGQNDAAEANYGEDSSGNGYDFSVENSGITISATDLPSGANPTAPASFPHHVLRRRRRLQTLAAV